MDLLLEYNKENANKHSDQTSLFGAMEDHSSIPKLRLIETNKATAEEKLSWEKELLGLYVSGHPLDKYKESIMKKDMNIKKALETIKEGDSVVFAGIINEVRTVQTKNNETMAFISISDFSGSAEAVVFPRVYREFHSSIQSDKCLAFKVTVNVKNGEKGFIIERVKAL
jgi:DNA polymerase-3 subunit alpha